MASNKKTTPKKAQAKKQIAKKPSINSKTLAKSEPNKEKAIESITPLKGKVKKEVIKKPCDTSKVVAKATKKEVRPLLSDEVVAVHVEKQDTEQPNQITETVELNTPLAENKLPEPLIVPDKPTKLVSAPPSNNPNVLQQQPEFAAIVSEQPSEVEKTQHKHEDLFKAPKRHTGSPLPF